MYASEREERGVWIVSAGLWALGGFAAWVVALASSESPPVAGGQLTLLALGLALVGGALRLPILRAAERPPAAASHLVWLLGCTASIHWLAVIMLCAESPRESLPGWIVIGTMETWILVNAAHREALPWVTDLAARLASWTEGISRPDVLAPSDPPPPAVSAAVPISSVADMEPIDGEVTIDGDGETIVRRCIDSVDAMGLRRLSGEVRVRHVTGQRKQTVAIAFCPALDGEPEVEIEWSTDRGEARLVHAGPTGMRIDLRRRDAGAEEVTWLQWQAVDTSPESQSQPIAASARMP